MTSCRTSSLTNPRVLERQFDKCWCGGFAHRLAGAELQECLHPVDNVVAPGCRNFLQVETAGKGLVHRQGIECGHGVQKGRYLCLEALMCSELVPCPAQQGKPELGLETLLRQLVCQSKTGQVGLVNACLSGKEAHILVVFIFF